VCPEYIAQKMNNNKKQSVSRQIKTTIREGLVGGFTCASDCCPIGESLQMDLAYKHLFTYSPGHLPGIINAETLGQLESNTELLVKVPGCCPFCEALNNGDCSPVEGKCDACAMGARKACKYAGDDYKWYVPQHLIQCFLSSLIVYPLITNLNC